MKLNKLPYLAMFSACFLQASAIVPKVELSPTYLRVTSVERTDTATRVGIKLQNLPNYWVMYSADARLISPEDTTLQYKLLTTENIPLDQKIWMPESCSHEGTLLFEPVPASVKVVDMVEKDIADTHNNAIGIYLDEEETRVRPNLITLSQIVEGKGESAKEWNGLNPEKYADLSFYDRKGTAHVRGKIVDYTPRFGVKTFTVRSNDDFLSKEKINVGTIAEDGSFEIDVPVTYPQFYYMELGRTHKNLFLIPGDTVTLATCMAVKIDPRRQYVPEYFGYVGEPNDAVAVNILVDSLLDKRYGFETIYQDYKLAPSDSMLADTYNATDKLSRKLDEVIADLPTLLGPMPVSARTKDILSSYAIGQLCLRMEDLEMDYNYEKGPNFRKNEAGEIYYDKGVRLDYLRLLASRLKHKDLIYNNPLIMSNGLFLINRWEYNNVFRKLGFAADGMMQVVDEDGNDTSAAVVAEDVSVPFKISDAYLDSIGVGNCFIAQLMRSKSLIKRLNTTEIPSSEALESVGGRLSQIIKRNDADVMNQLLMSEYNNFVKNVLIAENSLGETIDNSIIIEGTPEGEILEKIIEPYKGNVLYLDFWGIGCGPCRAGMIRQKPLLEDLADQPFKALYIANAAEGLEACKKWLREEEIKGEHIFVTDDDWKRLCGLFNVTGIPHGVLIGKDGKILNTDYHINDSDPLLLKALAD